MNNLQVQVWEEKVIIPTYPTGKPDKNPMFFEKRVYQGSSGKVYPHPIIEKIFDEKEDREYAGIYLENKYIKLLILPELGGRIQMAYDKVKERHFIYYNQVIKPALVGLTGPWISGGIEFNWPQHHRPSTFDPVDHKIEHNSDGSKTVWVNEVERMFHTKGMAGFTLHPDKAYIEIKAKLYNRSVLPQTFLWWANPAVKVNDDYQSVFPPDVNAVFDHGKRDVSSFPIATGTYYKVDYSPGTDISRYKNIPVPTSYMAINSNYDFVGGYEHDTKAGLLHVANHHVSPGKKQWTWGHSDFGLAWDRNLTDEDGPYIELMTGMFTDNQPDFTWIMPNEEKHFTQYFLPYRELGVIKNASKDILVALDVVNDRVELKIQVTSKFKGLLIKLMQGTSVLLEDIRTLSPEEVYVNQTITTAIDEQKLFLTVHSQTGKELIRYEAASNHINDYPEPAKPALLPEEIEITEQLFLTGQHLEQYRHATYSPVPYYEEALRRDAKDIRSNNALGLWHLRRGQFARSEPFFRQAIETSITRNPNPYDSECYYNLGLALKFMGNETEAYKYFYKATWSNAWKDNGFFSLAQIDLARGDEELALEHVQASLDCNANNSKSYVLRAAAYRKLQKSSAAMMASYEGLHRDPFNLGALFELSCTCKMIGENDKAQQHIDEMLKLSRNYDQNLIEYALDYASAALYEEARELLTYALRNENVSPMIYYYLGYFEHHLGNKDETRTYFLKAAAADPYLCFPDRLEDINVLQLALSFNAGDAKAPYYLGNLFYDKQQYDQAIAYWETSAALDDKFPTVLRNLAIAYFNKRGERKQAITYFEKAFSLDKTDSRVLMELDQLYKRLNTPPAERLEFMETYPETAFERDDLYLERVAIYNFLGKHQLAFDLISSRTFHPWEGGEGKSSAQYVYALLQLAKKALDAGDYTTAVTHLQQARSYPDNLGEGKLFGTQENDILYWLGIAYEGTGNTEIAKKYFNEATVGLSEPSAAIFYNDQQPDQIFYQGMAWKKLGHTQKAIHIFNRLISYGEQHIEEKVKIDYFAVSLPNLLIFEDNLDTRNQIHCLFLKGLGYLGLEENDAASREFYQVLELDAMHFGANLHIQLSARHTL